MDLIERSLIPNQETSVTGQDPLQIRTKVDIGNSEISLHWVFECRQLDARDAAAVLRDQLIAPMSSMVHGLTKERMELLSALKRREKELRDCLLLFQTYQPKVMPRESFFLMRLAD